ncbi:hypothetical protein HFN89_01830 [Rhizobium laguerreae]|nr:hypothetical protein [Rhizobium laguerreae]
MFGFAERINPKRSFLFVSKVLGRHIPVRPSTMRKSFRVLASQIAAELPGPVLFIGMAETAIGLGAGVHQQYVTDTRRDDAVYLCTTRYPLGTPLLCEFQEEHSHATRHLVHEPIDPRIRELVANARSLVLVDDEASTGKTFSNLFDALPEAIRANITDTVLVTLTDWSDGAAAAKMPGNVTEASILSGRYRWTPHEGVVAAAPQVPSFDRPAREEVLPQVDRDWARLGVVNHGQHLDAMAAESGVTLVLGTGEHVWQPFLLAERLEQGGADVFYSSVTRSPISEGHVIGSKFSFSDNYGGTVPNYLYNVDPARYGKIILCSETGIEHICGDLISALGKPVVVVDREDGV